jgi:choline dehydrogenase-like flavoprotein
MLPNDFKTKSLYGYGEDWPITYADLEPYYCKAEEYLGVSGTDSDNPFAPRRSRKHPLPPFELGYDDKILAERLRKNGIVLHTTPQARTREAFDGRPGCQNFGSCTVCPIGARYSPNHHLLRAVGTGLCKVHSNVSVRRIVMDESGNARALVYRPNDQGGDREHAAKVIIVAAGSVESVRLLLLSADNRYAGGLGNESGHLGKHFTLHHFWHGKLHYNSPLYPGRVGVLTGQSHQFLDPPTRGKHGGVKVELSSQSEFQTYLGRVTTWGTRAEILRQLEPRLYWHRIGLSTESILSPQKYVTLSEKRDRFGDPFAHVHYQMADFDHATYRFVREIAGRFAAATGADESMIDDAGAFSSAYHHMGGCRMGQSAREGVVNTFGVVHGTRNLFVVGGSNFVGSSGSVNPTLTMVALAMRTSDFLMENL